MRHRHRVVPKRDLLGSVWADAVVTEGSLAVRTAGASFGRNVTIRNDGNGLRA